MHSGDVLKTQCWLCCVWPVLGRAELQVQGWKEARNLPVVIGDLILKTAYLPVLISDTSLNTAEALRAAANATAPLPAFPAHTS